MLSSPLLFIKSTVRRRLMWTRRIGGSGVVVEQRVRGRRGRQEEDRGQRGRKLAKLKIYLPCRVAATCRESRRSRRAGRRTDARDNKVVDRHRLRELKKTNIRSIEINK